MYCVVANGCARLWERVMTEDVDSRLGRLLRASSVPQRDALFRIRLLERREWQRYRRQMAAQGVIVVLLLVVPLLLWVAMPDRAAHRMAPELVSRGLVAMFILALLAAATFSMRGILQAARWLRHGPRI
jgi:hypothetical protein